MSNIDINKKLEIHNYYEQEIINLTSNKFQSYLTSDITRKYIDFTLINNVNTRRIFKAMFWYNLEIKHIPLVRMLKWVARFSDLSSFVELYYIDIEKFKNINRTELTRNIDEFSNIKKMSELINKQFKEMILNIHSYINENSLESKHYIKNTKSIHKIELIDNYKNQDILNLNLEAFKIYKTKASKAKYIDFTQIYNYNVRNEIRRSLFYMLENKLLSLNSIYQCNLNFKELDFILYHKYKNIESLLEIDKYELYSEVKQYIDDNNLSKYKSVWINTTLKSTYNFLEGFDDENSVAIETSKDIWKLDSIKYLPISTTNNIRSINFTIINENYRELAKRYICSMLKVYSKAYVSGELLKGIVIFLNYINSIHSQWKDLKALSRKDMDEFFIYFNESYGHLSKKNISYLRCIKKFLDYIQVGEYEEAPIINSDILINKYDIPKEYKINTGNKYIPSEVIKQLDENLEYLTPSKYIPVVVILLASGFRISDVLNLRYNSCLEKVNDDTYFLVGDIVKTNVKTHRVPISASVAEVVKTQIKIVSSDEFKYINKDKLLFCTEKGKRIGLSYTSCNIRNALNKLSKKRNIKYQGDYYHFTTHQFRHTKAVELIDKGMELIHVQKWLAHRSSHATMHYAEVKEDTLRKSWEECLEDGFYKFSNDNKFEVISVDNDDIDFRYISENKDVINVGLGYCVKSSNSECLYSNMPCLTCKNLCVTYEFIGEYEKEIRKVKELINQGEILNRKMWIDKNKAILNKLEYMLNHISTPDLC